MEERIASAIISMENCRCVGCHYFRGSKGETCITVLSDRNELFTLGMGEHIHEQF